MKKILFYFLIFISLHTNAQYTNIPDPAFEQELVNQGYDVVIDGQVLTENINTIIEFVISANAGNFDMSGIEDFIALESLSISNSSINLINITPLVNLKRLTLYNNKFITSIDLTNNINLEYIDVSENALTSLDVSNNIKLKELWCGNPISDLLPQNNFTFIDLSSNPLLEVFIAPWAYLNFVNFNNNIFLNNIDLEYNNLITIDVSETANLQNLKCNNNFYLENLFLNNGNNQMLNQVFAINNPNLTCIEVDNETDANNNTGFYTAWEKDTIAIYSEDCATVSIEDKTIQNITLYPNPTNNMLYIENRNNINIKHIKVFNLLGQQVLFKKDNFNQIDLSSLKPALYLVTIKTENSNFNKKIIKK